jgi:hypothetical protein
MHGANKNASNKPKRGANTFATRARTNSRGHRLVVSEESGKPIVGLLLYKALGLENVCLERYA